MNDDNLRKQLAVFDSLLDDLAQRATNPSVSSNEFFAKVCQVIDAIVDPKFVLVLAKGPRDSVWLVEGDVSRIAQGSLPARISNWKTVDSDISTESVSNVQLVPDKPNVDISPILLPGVTDSEPDNQSRGNVWGWIVTEVKEANVSSIHNEILAGISEVIVDFLQTRRATNQIKFLHQYQQFSNNVHSSLSLKQVANHVANDGRRLLGVERVCVYRIDGSRLEILAISSVSKFEPRTELLQAQQSLVQRSQKAGDFLGSDQPPDDVSLKQQLADYQKISGFPFLFGMKIGDGKQFRGYLLAESNNDLERDDFSRGLTAVLPAASLALRNASVHEQIPFNRLLSAAGGWKRFISRWAIAAGVVLLTSAALTFMKMDFKVRIEGELRPVVERVVFAPQDGIVESVLVKHDDAVSSQQLLLKLDSPQLRLSLTQNEGKIKELSQLLNGKRIALNQGSSEQNVSPALVGQMTSEVSDIEFQIKSLDGENRFLREQMDGLNLLSPISGTVTTWRADEQLVSKPVRWGDPLLTIADEQGAWELRFQVPERRIGYILAARQSGVGEKVDFFFDSRPDRVFETSIAEIGTSANPDSELGPVTRLNCVAPELDYERRHGARVIADVHCGRRSIGYVWTHELIDSIRRKFVW